MSQVGRAIPEPSLPSRALSDVMEAVLGDGSPWSYLSASLFAREVEEFGAMWHGCQWSTHEIIDKPPWEDASIKRRRFDLPQTARSDWKWLQAPPTTWMPYVTEGDDEITVSFYTYSGLGQEALYHHLDRYQQGSYRFHSRREVIAEGEGGYVF